MGDGGPVIDADAIDELLRMVGDDQEFLADLIDTYLEDTPQQLAAMRAAAAAGDARVLTRAAHTVKTNSRNLGASALAELCLGIELDARRGDVEGMSGRVEAATGAFEAVRAELLAMRAA